MEKKFYKYGLIGYPLSHSFSPGYFAEKFKREGINNVSYELFPLKRIEEILSLTSVSGLNVTIPYKEQVIPYLDQLSPEAQEIGAVNTIKFYNGRKKGYNTDVFGFEVTLTPLIEKDKPESALVLGSGGAAKAVIYVLRKLEIDVTLVSRSNKGIRYEDVTKKVMDKHRLIINTTPLGMAPMIKECPDIPYNFISADHILYDLIYNPEKTLFLQKGEAQNARIKNGFEMLQQQAEKAWEIWNSH